MFAVDYYHKLKELYRKEVSRSRYIYIYTNGGVVERVLFSLRKGKFIWHDDAPHDELTLSRDKKLPKNVIVQVKFDPLTFTLFEG